MSHETIGGPDGPTHFRVSESLRLPIQWRGEPVERCILLIQVNAPRSSFAFSDCSRMSLRGKP